jgi:hypothetical protein
MTATADAGFAAPRTRAATATAAARAAAPATAAGGSAALSEAPEKFLPLTRFALLDRLTRPECWHSAARAAEARKFFQYLDFWRHQQYTAKLQSLEQAYEPFSPDSDTLITRTYTAAERATMQRRVIRQLTDLFQQANYTRVDPSRIDVIMTKESHYGLDLQVDLKAFEELLIFYRGRGERSETRRSKKRLYTTKEEYQVPILKRLAIVFKLKPVEVRAREVMSEEKCDLGRATKLVMRRRSMLPPEISADNIYMKLFKNIPQSDLEMVFPNTRIRFRMLDKVKLGATSSAGIGAGVFGAAGKLALLTTNPIAAAGAAVGLGGVLIRQGMNVVNQKNRYMVTMAQNLYFHSMADNRGVMTKIADRAAEEDIKEEMLLYTVLAKTRVRADELDDVDRAIEKHLAEHYEIKVDFDVTDALRRLVEDGIVRKAEDGTLHALQPVEAADHIDVLWDSYLDRMPRRQANNEGIEFDDEPLPVLT